MTFSTDTVRDIAAALGALFVSAAFLVASAGPALTNLVA